MYIQTTHIWSRLFSPIFFIFYFFIWIGTFLILLPIFPNNFLIIFAFIGSFGFSFIVLYFIGGFFHYLQTFLYVNINLGTKITFKEAKSLTFLFLPNDEGTWYPMKGIKELPKEYRRKVLFESTKRICDEMNYIFDLEEYFSTIEEKEDYFPILPGLTNLISMFSKIAKSDGIITKEEIEVINNFLTNTLKLNNYDKKIVVEIFNKSKNSDIPFEFHARKFMEFHNSEPILLKNVIQLLIDIGYSDGILSSEEKILLKEALLIFKLKESDFFFKENSSNFNNTTNLKKDYLYYAKILGITNEITKSNVKTAYRKLVLKYHPDKVSHLGLEAIKIAECEMKKINEAYEFLKKYFTDL